ncbi:peptidoglycan DD-metalloendopeptidase family protein [Chloroflexota bacterium]
MIDSQTELPVSETGTVRTWSRLRQVADSVSGEVGERVALLSDQQTADRARAAGQALGNWVTGASSRPGLARYFRQLTGAFGDNSLLSRYALHLVVILLALGVVTVSQITIPEVDFLLPSPTPGPELEAQVVAPPSSNRGVDRSIINSNTALFPAPVPHTIRPERDRMQVITYTVQPNDNLFMIANGFELDVETIAWANPDVEDAPDLLSVGQVLTILPINGLYYTVQLGDTVDKIAKEYKTTAEKIVGFESNDLEEPYDLTPGQKLILPDGRKKVIKWQNIYPMTRVGKAPAGAAKGSGRFAWPTKGYLSQGYWAGHLAIDVANRTGTPLYASDGGYVLLAGRDTWGYGNQVLIDHGTGFLTRYAHMDTIIVKAGQSVEKGQKIGTMGNTGRSTGPHLHFEIIQGSIRRNPLGFLP